MQCRGTFVGSSGRRTSFREGREISSLTAVATFGMRVLASIMPAHLAKDPFRLCSSRGPALDGGSESVFRPRRAQNAPLGSCGRDSYNVGRARQMHRCATPRPQRRRGQEGATTEALRNADLRFRNNGPRYRPPSPHDSRREPVAHQFMNLMAIARGVDGISVLIAYGVAHFRCVPQHFLDSAHPVALDACPLIPAAQLDP